MAKKTAKKTTKKAEKKVEPVEKTEALEASTNPELEEAGFPAVKPSDEEPKLSQEEDERDAKIRELEAKLAKVESKEEPEDLVNVEMTEDEREEFVKFKADKALAKKDEDQFKSEKKVNMRLATKHHINGKKFGPGVVQVPEYLVGKLQAQEENWRQHELAIFAPSKTHLKKILEGGVVLDVSPGQAPNSVKKVFGG